MFVSDVSIIVLNFKLAFLMILIQVFIIYYVHYAILYMSTVQLIVKKHVKYYEAFDWIRYDFCWVFIRKAVLLNVRIESN